MNDKSDPNATLRVGAVSYLNTKPLVYGLAESLTRADLVFDLPSRLADGLANHDLDIALIPSIEFFADPTYEIVSDACIACRGPVLSVKLMSRCPIRDIKTLALDEGSRTSVALVRILLRERYQLEPELRPLPIGQALHHAEADALLVIGDRAIGPDDGELVDTWDLGEEWCRWSGLPFVFAMWTARGGVDAVDLEAALTQARDAGVGRLPEIAEAESPAVGMTPAACLSYLRDNLYFYLGEREQRGLQLFYEHAVALGLAPPGLEIRTSGCTYS